MTKFLSGLFALALVAALGTGAQANNGKHLGWTNGHGMGHAHRCPPGQHWVKGYTNKWGKHVKGYCR
jgi:hypothetical protein